MLTALANDDGDWSVETYRNKYCDVIGRVYSVTATQLARLPAMVGQIKPLTRPAR